MAATRDLFMDRSALLLVDIQNDYFPDGKMTLEDVDTASVNAARLLNRFREKGWPVFHIRHLAIRPGATFFLPDTAGAEIHPSVAPMADESVIVKHFPNSFRETPLLDHLKKAGVTSVVVCGAMSHMCIDATTRAAFDLGFECLLAHDACAARDLSFGSLTVPAEQVHTAFVAALNGLYARALTVDEILGNG
jgi:nicotinamidase-related amidase